MRKIYFIRSKTNQDRILYWSSDKKDVSGIMVENWEQARLYTISKASCTKSFNNQIIFFHHNFCTSGPEEKYLWAEICEMNISIDGCSPEIKIIKHIDKEDFLEYAQKHDKTLKM